MHRVADALPVLGPVEVGQGHVGPDGEADQQIHDQIDEGPRGPHLGQGLAAREAADDHQVRRVEKELQQAAAWAQARCDNASKKKHAVRKLWAMRRVDTTTTLFEIVGLRLPEPLFQWAIRLIRSGKL